MKETDFSQNPRKSQRKYFTCKSQRKFYTAKSVQKKEIISYLIKQFV